jgi:formate dehydrogenase major subunit
MSQDEPQASRAGTGQVMNFIGQNDRAYATGPSKVSPENSHQKRDLAKPDLWIIQQIAKGVGLSWNYQGEHDGVAEVYEEMRQAMHAAISGITWARLQRESSVTYPCLSAQDPGSPTVFIDRFDTADGRVQLVPADIIPANERPDSDYPFVLITGRQLEHWHTGSMTRRATVLDAIEPMATASLCGADLQRLKVEAGDVITIASRRGQVTLHVRRDDGTPQGAVFVPFAYYEAAANLMTNAALDPFGKIPEFKYCAVAIQAGGALPDHVGFKITN